jgi:hypothetical protein
MAGSKTIKFKDLPETLRKGLTRPLKKTREYFSLMGALIDRQTQMQFRSEGGRAGTKWKAFSPATLQSPSGLYNIRYGTDLKGRPKGTYTPGKKRDIRRYSASSKLLQASGLFRKSFEVKKITNKNVVYGTNHELAGTIGSKPERQVLVVTDRDRQEFQRQFTKFYDKELIY